jgi:hypothetical protein
MAFACAVCGATHEGETRDIRMSLPEPVFVLRESERRERAEVGDDSAVLRDPAGDRFFVRSLLELPIEGEEGYFGYGTWIEVTRSDFEQLGELWHDTDGWRSTPFGGRLANELTPYEGTEGLPVAIRLREVSLLPLVELGETDHELVRAQRDGISPHRAHELAATVA